VEVRRPTHAKDYLQQIDNVLRGIYARVARARKTEHAGFVLDRELTSISRVRLQREH
jgi:hypothetical protein